jgi:hypothetical protein
MIDEAKQELSERMETEIFDFVTHPLVAKYGGMFYAAGQTGKYMLWIGVAFFLIQNYITLGMWIIVAWLAIGSIGHYIYYLKDFRRMHSG